MGMDQTSVEKKVDVSETYNWLSYLVTLTVTCLSSLKELP